ncbi:MAG: 50S ribosomal protein L6 [Nitrospira bacterium SG8_35_4]|nr:MAG: 50S ribosomal protein L6 [Nitrospira bacterium SG8_35_4]
MSRVGKNPVNVPDGVDVKIQGNQVAVKGPKGEMKWNYPADMKVSLQDKQIIVERQSESKQSRSLHGTTRSIIANMVTGISAGYTRVLEINGVGYRAQVQGQKITFTLGYSHPIDFNLPEGITAQVDKKQTQLTLEGIDKHLIGQVAANIRTLRAPNVYKGKGIKYAEEVLKLKVGKAGK